MELLQVLHPALCLEGEVRLRHVVFCKNVTYKTMTYKSGTGLVQWKVPVALFFGIIFFFRKISSIVTAMPAPFRV